MRALAPAVASCLVIAAPACARNEHWSASNLQTRHGTFFVVAWTPDYLIVSSESRQADDSIAENGNLSSRSYNDKFCKIEKLSNNSFFFSYKITQTISKNDSFVFNSYEIAKDEFNKSSGNIYSTTSHYASSVNDKISRVFSVAKVPPDGSQVSVGIFGGADGKFLNLGIAQTMIQNGKPKQFVTRFQPDSAGNIFPDDQNDLVDEVRGQKSDRARSLLDQISRARGGKDAEEKTAALATAVVAAVVLWSGNPAYGGEVSTVILDRQAGWKWYARPEFCSDN